MMIGRIEGPGAGIEPASKDSCKYLYIKYLFTVPNTTVIQIQ